MNSRTRKETILGKIKGIGEPASEVLMTDETDIYCTAATQGFVFERILRIIQSLLVNSSAETAMLRKGENWQLWLRLSGSDSGCKLEV